MGYRYNSPPNWPAPPSADWLPPDGWKPDPAWPPAPDGWNFWVEDPTFTGPSGGVLTAARPVVLKENRFRAQLHQTLAAELKPGEELRWFTVAYQYKAPRFIVGLFGWSILLPMIGPLIAMALRRPWSVGVTSQRVLLGHYEYQAQSKRHPVPLTTVPLGDVTVLRKGHKAGVLVLARRAGELPATLRLQRGRDAGELEALLHT
jgi:hypothetical protein